MALDVQFYAGCIRSFECSHSTNEEIVNLTFQTLQQTLKNNTDRQTAYCFLPCPPNTKTGQVISLKIKYVIRKIILPNTMEKTKGSKQAKQQVSQTK